MSHVRAVKWNTAVEREINSKKLYVLVYEHEEGGVAGRN
jgi:hypothetical protein